jgi:DNA-binding Xre family transcriptional regulator
MNFERIRHTRLEQGLSQQKLAQAAGVPRSQLQIVEAGGNVTLDTLEKLLKPLGLVLVAVSAAELQAAGNAMREVVGVLAGLLPGGSGGAPAAHPAAGMARQAAGEEPEVRVDAETLERIRHLDALVDAHDEV